MEGKAPSSIASDQAETDGSTQGGPPGHFNMQEKLHSLFSASSPGQPFNFNLPVSRQALSEAASLSSELSASTNARVRVSNLRLMLQVLRTLQGLTRAYLSLAYHQVSHATLFKFLYSPLPNFHFCIVLIFDCKMAVQLTH
jgi:hypothetical protein